MAAEAAEVDTASGTPDAVDPPVVAGALAVRERGSAMIAADEIGVDQLLAQHAKIQEAMSVAMTEGHHYGLIPGVKKPSLLKPGAEKLLVLFRLAPYYESEKIWHDDGHLTVSAICELRHIPTGLTVATGEGLCTTRESRYAYRRDERVCPNCGEPQVRKGKPRGNRPANWYCWAKQGGCGATWDLDSEQGRAFEGMETGRVPNPDLADTYNTVLKMADKRALVAAILNGTAASDVFTQDVEDAPRGAATGDYGGGEPAPEEEPVTWADLDPGARMHPDAPKNWTEIALTMKALDPSRDNDEPGGWQWIVRGILGAKYGVEKVAALGEHGKEAGRRMANLAGYLAEVVMEGKEFPPPTSDEIAAAVGWAFDGLLMEIPDPEPLEGEEVEPGTDAALTAEEAAQMAAAEDAQIEFGEDA